MMEMFTQLSIMLQATWWIALLSSFIWGALSIVLSPCHMATIPLIVGFINDRETITKKRAALLATAFASGILLTLALIGVITGLMGRILGDIGAFGNYVVGVFLIFFGIYMMDIIKLPFLEQGVNPTIKKKGMLSAFIVGLIFGIALGPCAFAFMAPMLGIVFNVATKNFIYAIALLLLFAVGHCSVIVLAGTFTEVVRKFLNWNEKSKGVVWLKRVCGVFIIFAAIYLSVTAA
jgi:cytochrome c-type biogenesis protein